MTYQNQNTQTNNNFKSEAHQRARFYVIEHIFFFYDKPETNPVIGISKDPAFRDNPDHKGFCYTERTNDGYGGVFLASCPVFYAAIFRFFSVFTCSFSGFSSTVSQWFQLRVFRPFQRCGLASRAYSYTALRLLSIATSRPL